MVYCWKLSRASTENIYVHNQEHNQGHAYFLEHNVKRFHGLHIDDNRFIFLWLIKSIIFILVWYPGIHNDS